MTTRVVYLMRGLPSCGKSYTARSLAANGGVVLETDLYFHTQVGNDPHQYDYDAKRLDDAREWNLQRFRQAVDLGRSPIIVDRGNGQNPETRAYAQHAVDHGYSVKLKEPNSPWWQVIRRLLCNKNSCNDLLDDWAVHLSQMNRATHAVPASTIRHWMTHWNPNLTVSDILDESR
jgi:predicted kinase